MTACSHFNWVWNIMAFGVNTMPADALAPKGDRVSAGMVLAMQDRQPVLLFQS